MGEYVPSLVPGLSQREVEPLDIVQPEGPSFSLDGNVLRWQNWSMRVGFNYREGLVLHRVGYEDGGRLRSIAHRLSFAEMIVPYRDPGDDHYRRTAFDIGEWGLGFMTTSLELGCDCLGEITYLDADPARQPGRAHHDPNAICIHEEDDAVLWKHVDQRRRRRGAPVAAAGRLVPRDGGQLRVPRLLALLPGRHDRVRDPGDRDHGRQPCRRRAAAVRHPRRRAHLRAVPPALHRRPPRPGGRRAGQHRGRASHSEALPDLRRQPVRTGAGAAHHAAADRGRGQAGLRLGHPARLEGGQHQPANRLGTPVSYKLAPAGALPADDRRGVAGLPARRGHRPHVVGDAVRPRGALAVRRVLQPERATTRACRSGPRPTAASTTPTSCSGTSSASTTSPGPRTGRSCRSTWCRSSSSRSASSTATPRSTCRPAPRTVTEQASGEGEGVRRSGRPRSCFVRRP